MGGGGFVLAADINEGQVDFAGLGAGEAAMLADQQLAAAFGK